MDASAAFGSKTQTAIPSKSSASANTAIPLQSSCSRRTLLTSIVKLSEVNCPGLGEGPLPSSKPSKSPSTSTNCDALLLKFAAFLQRTVTDNPFIPHTPTGRQATALAITEPELLFGGAAGGGKSDFLLMAALQFADVPGYSALLLRRTFADLDKPDSLIPRSHEWLQPTGAKWNGSRHQWTFPSGATLSFGYLDTPNDIYQYQGAAFQFCGYDELTQFTEPQYRYLFSRLRRPPGMNVPIRMRAGSNPGGVGHRWVKERFIGDHRAQGRWFIPSRISDNPHLDLEAYRKALVQLDHITRKQLEDGDWDVIAGGLLFKRHWFEPIDLAPTNIVQRIRYWDLAATKPKKANGDPDWTSGTLMSVTREGLFTIEDIRRIRDTPLEVEKLIAHTARMDGREVVVAMEQEPGAGGVITLDHYQRKVLAGHSVDKDKSITNKAARAKPLSSAAENGYVRMVRGEWNTAFLDEAELFPTGDHDDQVDSTSGAHQRLTQAPAFLFTA